MQRRTFLKLSLPPLVAGPAMAADSSKPVLSFGVIADPQYADVKAAGSRHYRESLGKLTAAIRQLNQHDLKFVVTLGDIIDREFGSYDKIMPLYEQAKAPRRFVLGNHDFSVGDDEKAKVAERLGLKKSYHAESISGWRFIYLDGTEVSPYRHPKADPLTVSANAYRKELTGKGQKAAPWGGTLSKDQFSWLEAELKKAKAAGERVILVNHFPAFPLKDSHNIWDDARLVKLLEGFPNVVAYLNGHRHTGNYKVNKGCHYVNFKGMVETKEKSAFAVVHCFDDRLEIDGFETEPDRECGFQIK